MADMNKKKRELNMSKNDYRDFSLSYGEDVVAEEIIKALNNKDKRHYSVYAPLSRQEKGIDLLIRNNLNGKTVSVQVKESKAWRQKDGSFSTWYNKFGVGGDIKPDYFALVTEYACHPMQDCKTKEYSMQSVVYRPLVLIYSYKEMEEELNGVVTQKTGNPDRMFSHIFSQDQKTITLGRGFYKGDNPLYSNTLNSGSSDRCYLLLEKRIAELKEKLGESNE